MSFPIYENGVAGTLTIDYGDYVLSGKLTSLELLNAPIASDMITSPAYGARVPTCLRRLQLEGKAALDGAACRISRARRRRRVPPWRVSRRARRGVLRLVGSISTRCDMPTPMQAEGRAGRLTLEKRLSGREHAIGEACRILEGRVAGPELEIGGLELERHGMTRQAGPSWPAAKPSRSSARGCARALCSR